MVNIVDKVISMVFIYRSIVYIDFVAEKKTPRELYNEFKVFVKDKYPEYYRILARPFSRSA